MMEDEYVVCQDLKINKDIKISVFGVFDGHGGNYCSTFISQHLVHLLRKKLVETKFNEQENFF